ncbi:MAG: SIMPL domain-containing protein [Sulfurovaceae bacterium]|nr:SIMPL domain-containing protein [Sulfurovaceae bacterium]
MQKMFFLFLLSINFLYSQTEIIFSRTFEKKIKPDTVTTSVGISSQKLSQEKTIEKLTKISDFMNSIKYLKVSGGEYSVNPHIVYDKDKSHQEGYDGYISYGISSKNPNDLNKLIRDIQRLGDEEKLAVTISSVSWQIDNEKQALALDNDSLRLDAIIWAKEYANKLSYKIKANCSVSRVDFTNPGSALAYTAMKAETGFDRAPVPIQDEQSIHATPIITLVCR